MSAQVPVVVLPPLAPPLGLVLAALSLAAVLTFSLPDDLLWQRVIEDAGHGPVFAVFALALVWMLAPRPGRPVREFGQYGKVFGVAVAVGIVTELLQWFLPERNVSVHDVLHDAAGAALGLASFWIVERLLARRAGVADASRTLAVAVAVTSSGFVLLAWQPLQCARAYAERARSWPVLLPLGEPAGAAFSTVQSARQSYGPLPARYARPGDGLSLRLQFAAGARPGLQLFEPPPD
ncbi:MAG: VanZ family protein [Gammaproteobacteria bacterium]|nr:VanZ family protein [Gammaproteobacteria bacterium]